MGHVARFGVPIPQELVAAFDARIQRKGYRTRSEAIGNIMREYLVNEAWASERGEVVGTVTIVYDHGRRELTHVLTELQHHFQGAVLCRVITFSEYLVESFSNLTTPNAPQVLEVVF